MTRPAIKSLVFIYNARKGLGNAILDSAHKIVSPGTYSCDLCRLTHGLVRERRAWKEFRETSCIDMEFLHKEEFLSGYASKFGARFRFPIILANTGDEFEVFLSPDEIGKVKDTEALISALATRLPS